MQSTPIGAGCFSEYRTPIFEFYQNSLNSTTVRKTTFQYVRCKNNAANIGNFFICKTNAHIFFVDCFITLKFNNSAPSCAYWHLRNCCHLTACCRHELSSRISNNKKRAQCLPHRFCPTNDRLLCIARNSASAGFRMSFSPRHGSCGNKNNTALAPNSCFALASAAMSWALAFRQLSALHRDFRPTRRHLRHSTTAATDNACAIRGNATTGQQSASIPLQSVCPKP